MDVALLRGQLAAFLGEVQYRKFVAGLRRTGRLRFWQEREWERFTIAYPSSHVSLDDLRIALRVCEIHATELLLDSVSVVEGNIDYAHRYVRARNTEFPNAAVGPVFTEGASLSGSTVDIWFCPDCRNAEARWSADRRRLEPSDLDLTRRTTLDEYEEVWGYGMLKGQGRNRWRELRDEIALSLTTESELWEWESVGFRELAGVCGLAVVRNGCIVRSWILGKS